MTSKLLYRIASVLLIVFAAGHTVGFLRFVPPSPEGRAVLESMRNVQFQVGQASLTYDRFYTGFGLFATVYLLFAAFLAWYLGGLAAINPGAVIPLAWGFFALQVASLILSFIYFLMPPVILSGLLTMCTAWAAWVVQRASS